MGKLKYYAREVAFWIAMIAVPIIVVSCTDSWDDDTLKPKWTKFYIDIEFHETPEQTTKACKAKVLVYGCAVLNKKLKVCTVHTTASRVKLGHEIFEHCVEHKAHKLYQNDTVTTL